LSTKDAYNTRQFINQDKESNPSLELLTRKI